MAAIRKPLQGIGNIIRFNWHFYVLVALALIVLLSFSSLANPSFQFYSYLVCIIIVLPTLVSLLVSFYVYDRSGLYELPWIPSIFGTVVNINAGFDETSSILKARLKNNELLVLDFYNPKQHTEVSIERARKAYPPFPSTQQVNSGHLPLKPNSVDVVCVIFAAHEIRNHEERIQFFSELKRVLKPDGKIYITEHLRDLPNFLAYNIGFFHFFSKKSWLHTFDAATLRLQEEIKFTPFISTFILQKNGTTL